MDRKWLAVLLVLLLCGIPLVAFTWTSPSVTCQMHDLAGTWAAEIWGGEGPGGQCWDQCELTVDVDGIILSGTYIDCLGGTSDVMGGQLTISPGCVIEGVIQTDGASIDVANGGIIEGKMFLGLAQPTIPPEKQ